tara:strand:- start:215 stop:433 length:219 start_codon:yes stop_codon:yes gene_type:complete
MTFPDAPWELSVLTGLIAMFTFYVGTSDIFTDKKKRKFYAVRCGIIMTFNNILLHHLAPRFIAFKNNFLVKF